MAAEEAEERVTVCGPHSMRRRARRLPPLSKGCNARSDRRPSYSVDGGGRLPSSLRTQPHTTRWHLAGVGPRRYTHADVTWHRGRCWRRRSALSRRASAVGPSPQPFGVRGAGQSVIAGGNASAPTGRRGTASRAAGRRVPPLPPLQTARSRLAILCRQAWSHWQNGHGQHLRNTGWQRPARASGRLASS